MPSAWQILRKQREEEMPAETPTNGDWWAGLRGSDGNTGAPAVGDKVEEQSPELPDISVSLEGQGTPDDIAFEPYQVQVGEGAGNVKRAVATGINAFLGPIQSSMRSYMDVFERSLLGQVFSEGDGKTPYVEKPADAPSSQLGRIGPDGQFQPYGEVGQSMDPITESQKIDVRDATTAERVAPPVSALTNTVGTLFAPISAQLGGAEELTRGVPIVGDFFHYVNKGFELLDSAGRWSGGKLVDALPVDEASRAVLREPIEGLAGLVGTLAGIKALHTGTQRGGGRAVEKLTVSEKTKSNINATTQLTAGLALQPFTTAYRLLSNGIATRVNSARLRGQKITPEVAKDIVNRVTKEVQIPEDNGALRVRTSEGPVEVRTEQKTVLENMVQGREAITYRIENGKQGQARFEWDFKKREAVISAPDKATAIALARELEYFFDQKLGAEVSQKLGQLMPNYHENRKAINQDLADYALEKLGGQGTKAQVDAKISEITDNMARELVYANKTNARKAATSQMALEFDALANKSTPELAGLAAFSKSRDGVEAPEKGSAPKNETTATEVKDVAQERSEPIRGSNSKGEMKTSRLAEGVADKVVEGRLAERFEGLPQYETINIKEQVKQADSLIKTDLEQAKRIALGAELPPPGLLPESVFTALEQYATKKGDIELLRDLATSSALSVEASAMGQRIRMLGEREPHSAVSIIRTVARNRENAAVKKLKGKTLVEAKAATVAEIRRHIEKPKADAWSSFVESIKC
jgi:hypothetical protein